jgi:PAS domain S-box-containing protein
MKKEKKSREDSLLRQKAEAKFKKQHSENARSLHVSPEQSLSEAEMQKLIHELQVYQIELEIQNTELQNAVEKAATAIALYDFAPNGYFTIGRDSCISQLNLSGAKMLGEERSYLRNRVLNHFITTETKPVFTDFLKKCFETSSKQTCEIGLAIQGKPCSFIYLEGMVTEDEHHCLVVAVDITERKQAEELLRGSENMYRLLARNLPDTSVFLFDHNLRFILAEGHLSPELGFTTNDMEGKTLWEVLPPERANRLAPIYTNALEGRPTENLISEFKGRSFSVNIFPVMNNRGEIIAGMVVSQEITKRKQVDDALRESEEKWRKLVNTIPDYVALYDRDGKYLFLNHFAEGFSMKDIEGKTYTDFLADDSKLIYEQAFNLAKQTNSSQYVEYTALGDNRSFRYYESFFVPIFENDEFVNMMVVARDITERKEIENDLKRTNSLLTATFESTADGLLVVDKMGKVTSYNEKFIELWHIPESIVANSHDNELITNILGQLKNPDGFLMKVDELYANDEEVSFDSIEFKDGRTYERYSQAQQFEGKSIGRVWSFRDVTARKQAEEALKTGEEIFNQFLENSPIYVFFKDENIRSLRLSRNFEEMLGKPLDELLGKSMYELFPSDLAKNMIEIDQSVIRKGERIEIEEEFNGRYFSTIKFPIQIEGKPAFLAGFTMDITERKLADIDIRESEERFRGLLQSVTSVSVQGYAPDGTTQYWNKASEQLYGYTEKEALGRNLLELIIPPEMREIVKQAIQQMEQTGKPIPSSELSLMRRDGSRVSVFSSHTIVQSTGKPQELFCVDIDLTDRKKIEEEILKSKEQYDNLVSKIPVGVYILKTTTDGTFALEYASPRMAEMLGLSVENLLADNEAIFTAIHSDDLEGFTRLNREGIEQKWPFNWKGRVVVNGDVRWLQISSTPEQLNNGDMLWHGLIVDITERMRDEEEIKLKNEELINLNATKDKFFSIIAHDLKSPFNSIIGFSSLLARQMKERDYTAIEKYADIIQNSSQQAMDLLMNLLEWTRSQTGRIVFSPENTNISNLVNQATELLFAFAQQKSITISKEVPDNLSISADEAMVSTILRNLISNAIKFTHAGGKIVISTVQMPDELVLSVADDGVGINKESIGKLFRIEESYSTLGTQNEKGTGLGLLLCKEFIDKHRGRIWVESESGKGSTFFFSIPSGVAANSSL